MARHSEVEEYAEERLDFYWKKNKIRIEMVIQHCLRYVADKDLHFKIYFRRILMSFHVFLSIFGEND